MMLFSLPQNGQGARRSSESDKSPNWSYHVYQKNFRAGYLPYDSKCLGMTVRKDCSIEESLFLCFDHKVQSDTIISE